MSLGYAGEEIKKELSQPRSKNVHDDLMRLLYNKQMRNNINKGEDPPCMNTHQRLSLQNDLATKEKNYNNQSLQWHPRQHTEDWHHKIPSYISTYPAVSRSVSTISSVTDDPHGARLDEEIRDRQNNSCFPDTCCYYPDFDHETECHRRHSSRLGRTSEVTCEDLRCLDDCDLHDLYDKIREVARLRRLRSSTESEPLCTIDENAEVPSVLAPQKKPPHVRNLVRVKPYKRHQMYQRIWKVQPAIGEDFHFSLRQKVREKMFWKDEVQLPHKMFIPNLYVVPSIKPRYDLRWIVRKCNHDYKMPPCGFFHDV